MKLRAQILSALAAEVAFAVLPLLVVLMVSFHVKHTEGLFSSPEWSFGAAILFGQALVKFVVGLAHEGAAAGGPVALAVAVVVVFGLAPSLVVLSMTLQAVEAKNDPAAWLQICQVILFLGGAVAYLLLGAVGEEWRKS
jgi:hypothetical protein